MLSQEQRQEIERKQFEAARKKALATGIPTKATMGKSWRQALKKEFEAAYFSKLMAFLEKEAKGSAPIYPPGLPRLPLPFGGFVHCVVSVLCVLAHH